MRLDALICIFCVIIVYFLFGTHLGLVLEGRSIEVTAGLLDSAPKLLDAVVSRKIGDNRNDFYAEVLQLSGGAVEALAVRVHYKVVSVLRENAREFQSDSAGRAGDKGKVS